MHTERIGIHEALLFIVLPHAGRFLCRAAACAGGRTAACPTASATPPPGQALAPNQLDDLVAPVALYPDPLVSQILVASTYPLELVQASQWLQRNPGLTGAALTQAAQQQNWDPSIQALVVFPDLVKRLNQDITWTTNLGNAFLSQQGDVMDAVQRMRLKAEQAGKLSSTSQQTVTTTNDSGQPVIEIQPANPQMMYLPTTIPRTSGGRLCTIPMQVGITLAPATSASASASRWDSILAADGAAGADGAGSPAGAATTSSSITASFTGTISTREGAAA